MDKKVTFNNMLEPKKSLRCLHESKMGWKSPFNGLLSDTFIESLQNLYKIRCIEIAKLKNEPAEYDNKLTVIRVREILNKQICETNRTYQIVYRKKGMDAMEFKMNDRETQTSPPKTNQKKELQDLQDSYNNVIAKVEQLEIEFKKSHTERGADTNKETISHVESFMKSCFFNAINILKTVIVELYLYCNAKFHKS